MMSSNGVLVGAMMLMASMPVETAVNPHKRTHWQPVAKPKPPRNHGPQPKRRKGGRSHNTKRSR